VDAAAVSAASNARPWMKRNGHQPGQCDGQRNRCAGLSRFAARLDRGSWWLLMIRGGSIVARSAAPPPPHYCDWKANADAVIQRL